MSAGNSREVATLAGGCFWCLEAVYDELRGVEEVESGYAGGSMPNPTYRPPPLPWTERRPGLVYAVLGLASAALLVILGLLARDAVRRHDSAEVAPPAG